MALILLGIFLGVLAARFLPPVSAPITLAPEPTPSVIASDSAAIQVSITPEITPAPTSTPAALLKLKWNVITVKSPVSFDASYRISYPTTWTVQEYKNIPSASDSGYSSLILAKGKTALTITQGAGDAPTCFYPGDNTSQQQMFQSFGDYREIHKGNLVWRLAPALPSLQPPISYSVCEFKSDQNYFNKFTSVGIIDISGTSTAVPDPDEINYILEKLQILP